MAMKEQGTSHGVPNSIFLKPIATRYAGRGYGSYSNYLIFTGLTLVFSIY